MAAYDMERFTKSAADNLYTAYKKGVFDASSSFKLSTSCLKENKESHTEIFNMTSGMILRLLSTKFGVEPIDMPSIWGKDKEWAYVVKGTPTVTKIVFGLFHKKEIKRAKANGATVSKQCSHCEKLSREALKCGACKRVYYCNKECQKANWSLHKGMCCKNI